MVRYKLTNLAIQSLSNVWNYTFDHWSEQQADSYHEQLVNAFESIAADTNHGRQYDGIIRDLHGFKVNRQFVFYPILSNQPVEIARILHERMYLKNRLK